VGAHRAFFVFEFQMSFRSVRFLLAALLLWLSASHALSFPVSVPYKQASKEEAQNRLQVCRDVVRTLGVRMRSMEAAAKALLGAERFDLVSRMDEAGLLADFDLVLCEAIEDAKLRTPAVRARVLLFVRELARPFLSKEAGLMLQELYESL